MIDSQRFMEILQICVLKDLEINLRPVLVLYLYKSLTVVANILSQVLYSSYRCFKIYEILCYLAVSPIATKEDLSLLSKL